MDMQEIASWLANPTGEGASDEEFAETIILAYKIWKTGNPKANITKDDMLNADTKTITSNIKQQLDEIIFSEEMDPSCWWKQEDE